MLLPFLPRKPHRFSRPASWVALLASLPPRRAGLGGLRSTGFGLPPRMADTDECGDRACFCMAEVMEMHSDITREIGSTATETGRLLYRIRGGVVDGVGGQRRLICESPAAGCGSMVETESASRFIVCRQSVRSPTGPPSNHRAASLPSRAPRGVHG